MDEARIEEALKDIEELKAAIKRKDRFLHDIAAPVAWAWFALAGAFLLGLFCIPAQVLSAAYGGFDAIPEAYRALLWSVLALIVVGGGAFKMVYMARQAATLNGANLGATLRRFFADRAVHYTLPVMAAAIVVPAFAASVGHPWYAAPAVSAVVGIYAIQLAQAIGLLEYFAMGYWSLGSGLLSLFFLERAPFLWAFALFGGALLCFALARLARRAAEGKAGS